MEHHRVKIYFWDNSYPIYSEYACIQKKKFSNSIHYLLCSKYKFLDSIAPRVLKFMYLIDLKRAFRY